LLDRRWPVPFLREVENRRLAIEVLDEAIVGDGSLEIRSEAA
jgi:hypothetical protein